VILLIGPTGSGKSSFIRSLTKEKVEVNGQKPCTTECKDYLIELDINGRTKTFILVDTPGFEDFPENNLIALRSIAEKLSKMRPQVVYGAIYFHRIINGRFHGTTRSILSIFKSICGDQFFDHVAFVTTMWDAINDGD
ncbi:P-loop containing nucleoside triphosphate hydrolase protein, partial [Lasiosphaeris hirsuta]